MIMTRNVTDFISLSSLSPHARMLSKLNCAVPLQSVYAQERGNEEDGFILSDFRQYMDIGSVSTREGTARH